MHVAAASDRQRTGRDRKKINMVYNRMSTYTIILQNLAKILKNILKIVPKEGVSLVFETRPHKGDAFKIF